MGGSLSADFSDSEVSELDFCLSGGITGLREQACALVPPFPSIGNFSWEQWCPWDPLCWAIVIRAPVILQICDASWNIIICSIKDLFRFVNSLFSSAHLRRTSCFSSLGRVTWSHSRWVRSTFHECLWESPSLSLASLSLERSHCWKSWRLQLSFASLERQESKQLFQPHFKQKPKTASLNWEMFVFECRAPGRLASKGSMYREGGGDRLIALRETACNISLFPSTFPPVVGRAQLRNRSPWKLGSLHLTAHSCSKEIGLLLWIPRRSFS